MTYSAVASWRHPTGGPVSTCIPVENFSRVGEARRAADTVGAASGLDEEARGVLGLVVTELATNLAKHATGGLLYIRDLTSAGRSGVELLAVDSGPGMMDLRIYEADGFSTKGTAGQGLGAMRRLADEFDIYSQRGVGTVLVARVLSAAERKKERIRNVEEGVVCTPIQGEVACGDGWALQQDKERSVVLMVDGLGHGPDAAQAADAACEIFAASRRLAPLEVLGAIHAGLRSTRGAAVMILEIVPSAEGATVKVAGAGNIFAAIVGANGTKALPSINGTAGAQLRSPREFSATFARRQRLVVCTDGITTRWKLEAYPGVFDHDPAIAAALLRRDHSRGRDDATVLTLALGTN